MKLNEIKNQPVLSRIINKINSTSNNSQGYLLVSTSKDDLEFFSVVLSKVLICPQTYEENCTKCNICKRISNNTYGELRIVRPTNLIIKKEDIIGIKEKFQTEPVEGKNYVYIITDAQLLNVQAANSILKFLEEPDSHVVAIFTTTNLDKVINTIKSRCQIIKLNNNKTVEGLDFVLKFANIDEDKLEIIMDFFFMIENNIENAIINSKKIISVFDTKEFMQSFLNTILLLYEDVLNYKIFGKMKYFFNETGIKNLSEKQTNDIILKKISFILENISKLEYNVNMLLFIDNLLIGIGEINNDKSNRN